MTTPSIASAAFQCGHCPCHNNATFSQATRADAQNQQTPKTTNNAQASPHGDPLQKLAEDEQQKVKELAARDREVKAQEAAHKAAGAGLTGPASYRFAIGPDRVRYAISGEVSENTAPVAGNPTVTMLRANGIHAAALALAQPSSQDLRVASQEAHMAAAAFHELSSRSQSGLTEKRNDSIKNHFLYLQTARINDSVDKWPARGLLRLTASPGKLQHGSQVSDPRPGAYRGG